MTADPLIDLGRADAPEYPDTEFAERLLDELLDQMSRSVDVSIPHEPASGPVLELKELEEMDTSARKWFLPALAAAAVVALLVAGFAVASREDDQPGPADEPISTVPAETAAPAEADEPLALGEAMIAALNERDTAAVAALLADEATVAFSSARNEDDLLRLIDFFAVDGTTFDFVSCQPGSVYTVTCTAEFSNELLEAVGSDPSTATFRLRIADGQITALLFDEGRNFGPVVEAWLEFIQENHPEDFDKMILVTSDSPAPLGPQLTEESFALQKAYIAEFAAANTSE